MEINSKFDGGNIKYLEKTDSSNISLQIVPDAGGEFFQWFYFRISNFDKTRLRMNIVNAGEASYPKGWQGYQAVTSSDRLIWSRVKTTYEGGILTIDHKPDSEIQYYAYFAPYSLERHNDLIAKTLTDKKSSLIPSGLSSEGRQIDVIRISNTSVNTKTRKCWIIARQHPGETMAEWLMEGVINKLLAKDSVISKMLETTEFYLVPNMNPDGSFLGYLRTNAKGINLNREWENPCINQSPEVFYVRKMMIDIGCDFFLDIHGDEAIPYNFIAGPDGIPSLSDKQIRLVRFFENSLCNLSPDFQNKFGYPVNQPGKANLKIAGNWVAENFSCPGITLEQPFKDNALNPDSEFGWSPEKAFTLGQMCVSGIAMTFEEMQN